MESFRINQHVDNNSHSNKDYASLLALYSVSVYDAKQLLIFIVLTMFYTSCPKNPLSSLVTSGKKLLLLENNISKINYGW